MGKRVLVVDDDAAVLNLLTERFRAEGLEVVPCANGASALARIADRRFDAAVFDIQMPGASGVDLLRRFRERHPGAPAFIVSGAITAATQETIDALGARSFDKPFDLEQLTRAVTAAAAQSTAAHPWSILVVDDAEDIRKLLHAVLSDSGYAVVAAGDGAEGLKAVRAAPRPFDIAITDINMPNLNGVTFIRELQRAPPETLPIIMTGEGTSAQVEAAYRAGAETMIRKPFDVNALRNFVDALDVTIRERRAQAAARREREARGPLKRAADGVRETMDAPAGTPGRERRNVVLTLIVAAAATVIVFWAWRAGVEESERRAQETRRAVEGLRTTLERLREPPPAVAAPVPSVPPDAGGRPALDPETSQRLGEFLKRVEGYLERDEQRELDGRDGPVKQ
jgi:two-component system chemotaxis response regulator CheY